MGNWTSANKAPTAPAVDPNAFKEEKAPNPGVAARTAPQEANPQAASAAVAQQAKPKAAVVSSGGMRAQTAIDAPLK